jgi:hypothetical protein
MNQDTGASLPLAADAAEDFLGQKGQKGGNGEAYTEGSCKGHSQPESQPKKESGPKTERDINLSIGIERSGQ